jgi:hypothetical protein
MAEGPGLVFERRHVQVEVHQFAEYFHRLITGALKGRRLPCTFGCGSDGHSVIASFLMP